MRSSLLVLAVLLCGCEADEDLDLDGFIAEVDCDDEDADIYPGASELCNGVDENCNGVVDEGYDFDGDGILSCNEEPLDCDDADAAVFPGATERCDGLDQDCDGEADNGFDNDGDGITTCMGDCDDANALVSPMAEEACDGVDNDCDGRVDEAFDFDADGVTRCGPDGLAATADDDCEDMDSTVYPGAPELCDGLDNDCDQLPDLGEFDWDGDGLAGCQGDCDDDDPAISLFSAEQPCNGVDDDCNADTLDDGDGDGDGHSICDGDCDDDDSAVFPWAVELCNDLDDDCDGLADEDFDVDFDGVSSCGGDCNDHDRWVYPGGEELCDDVDNNCDGAVDEGFADTDGDAIIDCLDLEQLGADCDDGVDNNGDGYVDCDDPTCVGVGSCPVVEVCHNEADDDDDGLFDCFDDDCWLDEACTCEVASTLDCTTETLVWADLNHPSTSTDSMDAYLCDIGEGYYAYTYGGPEHVIEFTAPYEGLFEFRRVAPVSPVDIVLLSGETGCQPDACLDVVWGDEVMDFWWYGLEGESLLLVAEHASSSETPDRFTLEVSSCTEREDEVCDDGIDNDLDGGTDCADDDCSMLDACNLCLDAPELACFDKVTVDSSVVGTSIWDDYSEAGWSFTGNEVVWHLTVDGQGGSGYPVSIVANADHDIGLMLLDVNAKCNPETDCFEWSDKAKVGEPEFVWTWAADGDQFEVAVDGYDGAAGEIELLVSCGYSVEP